MAEETKEVIKSGTQDAKQAKQACCSGGNHSAKTLLIVLGIVLILGGLGAAAKIAFFGRESRERTSRSEMMRPKTRFNRPMMGRQTKSNEVSGFGVSGTITAVNGDKLTVKTSDKDQIVDITDATSIIKDKKIAAKGDLQVNDKVVTIGTSNSAGELVATLIRVQPS